MAALQPARGLLGQLLSWEVSSVYLQVGWLGWVEESHLLTPPGKRREEKESIIPADT